MYVNPYAFCSTIIKQNIITTPLIKRAVKTNPISDNSIFAIFTYKLGRDIFQF